MKELLHEDVLPSRKKKTTRSIAERIAVWQEVCEMIEENIVPNGPDGKPQKGVDIVDLTHVGKDPRFPKYSTLMLWKRNDPALERMLQSALESRGWLFVTKSANEVNSLEILDAKITNAQVKLALGKAELWLQIAGISNRKLSKYYKEGNAQSVPDKEFKVVRKDFATVADANTAIEENKKKVAAIDFESPEMKRRKIIPMG